MSTVSWNAILLLSLIVTICIYITQLLKPWLRGVRLAFSLPGPPALPVIGNCLMVVDPNCINTIGRTARETYGPLMRGWISVIPSVILTEPEHVQLILASPKHTGKTFLYRLLHNFLGEGLITSTGIKWRYHRRLIQPLFTKNILETFIETFSDSSQLLITKLSNIAEKDINITSFINSCVLDILNEAVLGIPVYDKGDINLEDSPFRKGEVVAPYRLVRPWLLFNGIYNLTNVAKRELQQKQNLINFTRKMIEYNRTQDKTKCTGRKSLLSMFQEISEVNSKFTEEDIIQEICTFMLAGQDSVGSAVAFCLFLLAQHQNYQNMVIEEINNIFKESDRLPTARDLDEMCFLDQCIKETLRLYPSVPLFARSVSEDIKLNEKVTIPKYCTVFITPFVTHRIPEIYPNPESFMPERFSPEQTIKRHPYAFIPFSAGPRNCIGYKFAIMEMKVVISTILRHYKLMLCPGKENLQISYRITVRAKGGIWLRLLPRNSEST